MIVTFTANRLFSKGNLLFPNKIIIDTSKRCLSFYKRNNIGIGYFETSIFSKDITTISVHHRNEFLMYSTVYIESKGGLIIQANGFDPKDAVEIKNIIENL